MTGRLRASSSSGHRRRRATTSSSTPPTATSSSTSAPPATGSLWHATLEPGDGGAPRPDLDGDLDVDVAIVGGGFTGAWTAYHLSRADPNLRIVVLERDVVGFGASGRNGGWCVGDQAAPPGVLDRTGGPGAAQAMIRAVQRTVDEIGEIAALEGIDCGFAKAGALYLASDQAQLARLGKLRDRHLRSGVDATYELWDARRVAEVVDAVGVIGALYTPHAAAVHPARLVRGVARAAERGGVTVHEQTAVRAIEPRRLVTDRGTVRAEVVVRATEAYSSSLEGHRRTTLPLCNYMIATEPIDDATWARIGLARRELFEDACAMLAYGQRTSDGRIAWGGLSGPYRWGSRVPSSPMRNDRVGRRLRRRLVRLFPALSGIGVTHHWGGVLGVSRDMRPSVGLDRATGLAWAGGYTGSGVAPAYLAGLTLAHLITGQETDETRLAWVGHRSRAWEPEPLRWLGVHAVTTAAHVADRVPRRRR